MSPKSGQIVSLTRRNHFSAGHRLSSKELSEAENFESFGKCAHSNGHGHNYIVEITIRGPLDPVTGMVMNIRDLQETIDKAFLKLLDHKNLDQDVPYFENAVSTTENLSIFIWNQMKKHLENPKLLYKVKLWSTKKNIAVYKGLKQ